MRVGLISDTHGLLRPEALAALQGCELILHAGDIGKPQVLEALGELAPVQVVRGNNDVAAAWAAALPDMLRLTLGGCQVLMLHDLADVAARLHPDDAVVITGHSHKPLIERRDGRLYVNPGSAGPRRFRLPVSVALLQVDAGQAQAELIELAV